MTRPSLVDRPDQYQASVSGCLRGAMKTVSSEPNFVSWQRPEETASRERSRPREAVNVGARRRISRTRTPANSSTAAQGWLQLARGIRRTQSHDDAWYTCRSRSSSYTCHSRCSSEFKDFEIGFLKDVRWLRRAQAPERKPSNAWARKMPALIRPKNAVTVSIIAKIPCAPAGRERHAASHSQRNFRPESKIGPD